MSLTAQENVVVMETYFGLDVIERVEKLLETGVFFTDLKHNHTPKTNHTVERLLKGFR